MRVWLLAEGAENAEMWLMCEAASYELIAARRADVTYRMGFGCSRKARKMLNVVDV
jgi:hypothetical protein